MQDSYTGRFRPQLAPKEDCGWTCSGNEIHGGGLGYRHLSAFPAPHEQPVGLVNGTIGHIQFIQPLCKRRQVSLQRVQ